MSAQTPKAMFRLDGLRAAVTGSGRGLGLGIAQTLAAAGAEVTLLARTRDEVEAGAESIRASGGAAEAAMLDVGDVTAVAKFFASQSAFDILVNNAGTNRPKPIEDIEPEDFDAVLDLNLRSAFFVAKACVQQMRAEGKGGSLVHISSQMGHVGAANRSLYCASKWGLEGMSKALAIELAPHGIRSNTVAPTFVETPMTSPFLSDPDFREAVLSKIKLGRLGTVEDVAAAVLFLAARESGLVTATSVIVDGGWTAG